MWPEVQNRARCVQIAALNPIWVFNVMTRAAETVESIFPG